VQSLDADRRWDRELSEDEQMALTLARVILQAPLWVVFDDAFSSMEDATLRRVVFVCAQHVTNTTIIHIGRSTHAHMSLFKRVLHLTNAKGEARGKSKSATERKLRAAV
jgi:putative ATP-binding cassette transporter